MTLKWMPIHAPAMTRPEAALLPAELPERSVRLQRGLVQTGSVAGRAVLRAPGVRLPGVGGTRDGHGCK